MKDAFRRLLSSMKFWTLILGVVATVGASLFAKYGLELSDSTVAKIAELLALGFGVLLGAQGATDLGKARTKVDGGGS